MRKTILSITLLALVGVLAVPLSADACTGITLRSKDGTTVVARTIEWAGSNLNSQYVVVPRGYTQQSYTPDGGMNGMRFTARHGYVGFAVEQKEFTAVPLLFVRQKRREQNSQIIIRCPHADALHLGCLGVVINRRLVRHRKEHIAQTRRAFLTEKCRALGRFGKLRRVGRGQQMFHLV